MKVVDVETAFLYGKFEDEIFMECPPGMKDVRKNDSIILGKCICGLVHAVIQYSKKAVEVLKK